MPSGIARTVNLTLTGIAPVVAAIVRPVPQSGFSVTSPSLLVAQAGTQGTVGPVTFDNGARGVASFISTAGPWLTITNSALSEFSFSAAANGNSVARVGTVEIRTAAGSSTKTGVLLAALDATQFGTCMGTATATAQLNGGTNPGTSISITTSSSWTAATSNSWIVLSTSSGASGGALTFSTKVNGTGATRSGKISVNTSACGGTPVQIPILQQVPTVISLHGQNDLLLGTGYIYRLLVQGSPVDSSALDGAGVVFSALPSNAGWNFTSSSNGEATFTPPSTPQGGATTIQANALGLQTPSLTVRYKGTSSSNNTTTASLAEFRTPTSSQPRSGAILNSLSINAKTDLVIRADRNSVAEDWQWIQADIVPSGVTPPVPVNGNPPIPACSIKVTVNVGGYSISLAGVGSETIPPSLPNATLQNSYCKVYPGESYVDMPTNGTLPTGLRVAIRTEFLGQSEPHIWVSAKQSGLTDTGVVDMLSIPVGTSNPPPVVSVWPPTPSQGESLNTDSPYSFVFNVRDTDLSTVDFRFGDSTGDLAGACAIHYDRLPGSGSYYLWNDAGTVKTLIPTSGSASNGQCTVSAYFEDWSFMSPNLIHLTTVVRFTNALTGPRVATVAAKDAAGGVSTPTFVQSFGIVNQNSNQPPTVPLPSPQISGTGLSKTISLIYHDENGSQDIQEAGILVSQGINLADCFLNWSRSAGGFRLMDSTLTGWVNAATGNGNCRATGGSVVESGKDLTLTATIELLPTAGNGAGIVKSVYGWVIDTDLSVNGGWSGWTQVGTWTPVSAGGGGGGSPGFVVTRQLFDTAQPGGIASFKLIAQSINGYAGTVSFSAPTVPSGWSACSAIQPIVLTANGTGNTTMTCPIPAGASTAFVYDPIDSTRRAPDYTFSGVTATASGIASPQPVAAMKIHVRSWNKPVVASVTPATTALAQGVAQTFTITGDWPFTSGTPQNDSMELRFQDESTLLAGSCNISVSSGGAALLNTSVYTLMWINGPNAASSSNSTCSVNGPQSSFTTDAANQKITANLRISFANNSTLHVYGRAGNSLASPDQNTGWKDFGVITVGTGGAGTPPPPPPPVFSVVRQISDSVVPNTAASYKLRVTSNSNYVGQVTFNTSGLTFTNTGTGATVTGISCNPVTPVSLIANGTVEALLTCPIGPNVAGTQAYDYTASEYTVPSYTISGLTATSGTTNVAINPLILYVRQAIRPKAAVVSVTPAWTQVPQGSETIVTAIANWSFTGTAINQSQSMEVRFQEEGVSPTFSPTGGCSIYIAGSSAVILNGGSPAGNVYLGYPWTSSPQNSACQLRGPGGTFVADSSAQRVTVTLPMTFFQAKTYHVYARGSSEDSYWAGWKDFGTLVVGNSGVPKTALSGVVSTGVVVNNGEDQRWRLVSAPVGVAAGVQAKVITADGLVVPPNNVWQANTGTSTWVGPTATPSTVPYSPAGEYVYRLTFRIEANGIPSTAEISGAWAVDNKVSIRLNGTTVLSQTPPDGIGYGVMTPFSIVNHPAFLAGDNVLDFVVTNQPFANAGANPTALRVEISKALVRTQ
jgi:hypothetical protein